MEARTRFIEDFLKRTWSIKVLCGSHGISRKTAYKWIHRFEEEGLEGLEDRSRAPRGCPNRTSTKLEDRIVAAANEWEFWGPRKLRAFLVKRFPETRWPSRSTIGEILIRRGVRRPSRPRASRREEFGPPEIEVTAPNDLWRADFKGWCRAGDRRRCEPLAMTDALSRFATCCDLVNDVSYESSWPLFVEAFERYGLPLAILTDNGPPFASVGLCGLSKMSVNWIRLGIRVIRTEPGKPTQNGGQERFNFTLAREAMSKKAATWEVQRQRIHRFRKTYNEVRPHEALGDRTPSELYTLSPRKMPKEIPEFDYPDSMVKRTVDKLGMFSVGGRRHFLSETLTGLQIGLEQFGVSQFAIRFGPLEVGLFDAETGDVIRHSNIRYAEDLDE